MLSRPTATGAAAVTSSSSSLTDADLARAAELEAQIVAQAKSAAMAQKQSRSLRVPAIRSGDTISGGTIAAFASEEYAYVARDIRRIVLIGGSLIGLLFGGWALIQVTGVELF